MQTHLLRQWLRLAVAAVAVFFAACGDSDGDAATARVESCELERSSIVGGQIASGEETASLRVIVEVSGSGQLNYTATITSGDWLSLSARDFSAAGRQRQGTVDSGENLLFFYYKANASAQSRIATFTIAFDDGSAPYDFELTQLAPNATDNPYDTPKQWPELPAGKEETDYIYAAHYAKMNLKTVRTASTRNCAWRIGWPIRCTLRTSDRWIAAKHGRPIRRFHSSTSLHSGWAVIRTATSTIAVTRFRRKTARPSRR